MASIAATVIVGKISLRATARRTLPIALGPIPEKAAASSDANMHDVPEADSQLKLNIAAYFAGVETTGGMRRIWLCSPGHAKDLETLFSRTDRKSTRLN